MDLVSQASKSLRLILKGYQRIKAPYFKELSAWGWTRIVANCQCSPHVNGAGDDMGLGQPARRCTKAQDFLRL